MNKIHYVFRFSLLMLIFLLISACSDIVSPYEISLMNENHSHVSIQPNQNIAVHVSEQIENPQLIGGSDSLRNISFKEIIPWLRSRLGSINSLNCGLTKKINIKIAVKKLYTSIDSDVLVGALVLNAKIATVDGKTLERNYRGDCKMGFLTFSERNGVRTCLNSSLDLIISSMRHDICEINM